MHLHDRTDIPSHDSKIKMPIAEVDAHFGRVSPGNVKSPRLERGIRQFSNRQQNQSQCNAQPPTSSISFTRESVTQEPVLNTARRLIVSCCERKMSSQTLSWNAGECPRYSCSNGSRPLFHHQRHSLKNKFQKLRTLGEGTYGKVKLAVDKGTGEHVAVKYIKKTKIQDENAQTQIRREIQILSSLRHQHIVNIREVFEKRDKIVLVMEYAPGGELYDYLNNMGRLSEPEARRIFRQIVSAIHCCHQNGIVHRDLKLENIILDVEANVKIADFGLSNYYSLNSTLTTFCGSPLYASPEIVNGQPYHGPEVDVWSLGVILYTLVYGAMPFESTNLAALKQQISHGDYIQQSVPSDADALIHHMLTPTPSRRASIQDILSHWWINVGYSHMPNGQPYDPFQKLRVGELTLAANRRSLAPTTPVIIHHNNQSSISSDSDVEFDSWSGRSVLHDTISSNTSSSVNANHTSTQSNHSHCIDEGLGSEAIPIRLLKLPPDVLEILKGCSRETLAALVSTDNTSPGFNVDANGNKDKVLCQTNETESGAGELSQRSSPVFDSEKKPKKGILKRKGKFAGGDSGCVMPEDMTTRFEDLSVHESDQVHDKLPAMKDEASAEFSLEQRTTHRKDNSIYCLQYKSCRSAIPARANKFSSLPLRQ